MILVLALVLLFMFVHAISSLLGYVYDLLLNHGKQVFSLPGDQQNRVHDLYKNMIKVGLKVVHALKSQQEEDDTYFNQFQSLVVKKWFFDPKKSRKVDDHLIYSNFAKLETLTETLGKYRIF